MLSNKSVRTRAIHAILVLALVLSSTSLWAQDNQTLPVLITEVDYSIDGRTRQWALEDVVDIREGLVFESRVELEAFLEDQHQLLINQRQLQEATVSYRVLPTSEDADQQMVVVEIAVVDTLNIIALPYFRYDSNDGLLLSLRGRDYNFFGTLQELSLDLDYERTEDEEDIYTVKADFTLPFNMFERRWQLSFEQSFSYEASDIELEGNNVDFETAVGLGYEFDWVGQTWLLKYTQGYRYMTDDPDADDTHFLSSRLGLGTTIDTGAVMPGFGMLEYSPELFTQINYWPGGVSDERDGLETGFRHSLGAGRTDWFGNYRNGQTIELENTNVYNFEEYDAGYTLEFETAWYRKLWHPSDDVWPKAGVSGRVFSFYLIDGADEDQDDAAKEARGILNDRMNGNLGLFLNLDAAVTVWTLEPIFEMQFGGFFDVAMVRDLRGDFYDDSSFNLNRDVKFGGGIEVIGFPLFARSLYIRGSYGVDLGEVADGTSPLDGQIREIFIGLGHHY